MHPSKAQLPIEVRVSGNLIEVKEVQSLKALSLTEVTFALMVTEVMEVPLNAEPSNPVTT